MASEPHHVLQITLQVFKQSAATDPEPINTLEPLATRTASQKSNTTRTLVSGRSQDSSLTHLKMSGLLPSDHFVSRRSGSSSTRHATPSFSEYPYRGIGLYDHSTARRESQPHMLLSESMRARRANAGYAEPTYGYEHRPSQGSSSHANRGSDGYYYGSSDASSAAYTGSTRRPSTSSYRDPYYVGSGWEEHPSSRTSSSAGTRRRSGSEAPHYLPNRNPSYFEVRQPYRDLYASSSGQREYYSGTGQTSSYHPGGHTVTRPSDRRPWR